MKQMLYKKLIHKAIIVLLSLTVITLFYFETHPSKPILKQYTITGLPIEDELTYKTYDSGIWTVVIEFEGKIDGNLTVYFQERDGNSVQAHERNFNGLINEQFQGEWFTPKCKFRFIPENTSVTGLIDVKIQMYHPLEILWGIMVSDIFNKLGLAKQN